MYNRRYHRYLPRYLRNSFTRTVISHFNIGEFNRGQFGFERVFVQKEEKNGEVFEGYDIEVKKLLPFLYKWERQPNDPAYRVTIGEKKYYYTIVSC